MAFSTETLKAITARLIQPSLDRMRREMEGRAFMMKCIERGGRMKLTPLGGIGSYQGTLVQFIPNLPPFPCGVFRYERPGVIAR